MKTPKFLHNYLEKKRTRRCRKRYEKRQKSPEYQIEKIHEELDKQSVLVQSALKSIQQIDQEKIQEELKKRQEEEDRTDPFKADKWKVVYDSKNQVSTVYFNGQELYGVAEFKVDFDAALDGQTPRFTYEGYGSIEIVSESE